MRSNFFRARVAVARNQRRGELAPGEAPSSPFTRARARGGRLQRTGALRWATNAWNRTPACPPLACSRMGRSLERRWSGGGAVLPFAGELRPAARMAIDLRPVGLACVQGAAAGIAGQAWSRGFTVTMSNKSGGGGKARAMPAAQRAKGLQPLSAPHAALTNAVQSAIGDLSNDNAFCNLMMAKLELV